MKRILMMIAVVLISTAIVSAQDRSATVTEVNYNALLGIRTSPTFDVMVSYPERLGFIFENAKPINVRMAIYIPCSDYAQSIFPLTDDEIAQHAAASSTQLKAAKTIGVDFIRNGNQIIRRGENGFVEPEKQERDKIQDFILEEYDTNSHSLMRASSSSYVWAMDDSPMVIQNGTDEQLDDKITQLKATAFAVWRSDWQDDTDMRIATDKMPPTFPVQHFEPGTNTAFFQWYSYSNRNGANGKKVEKIVYDDVYYVLENADTGEILAVLTYGRNAIVEGRLLSRTINSVSITESLIDTMDMKTVYFLITDPMCNYTLVEAARKLETLFDFYCTECIGGVVAYAVKDNVQGELKALEPSDVTWKPAANVNNPSMLKNDDGKYYLNGTYYLLLVHYKSFDEKGLSMGTGTPYFGVDLEPITFNNFPLLMPKADDFATGIEKVKTDELKVVWKDNIPYMVINGQEIKADIYDLTGKKVQFVESDKFYILQAQTAEGKKYTQKVIR